MKSKKPLKNNKIKSQKKLLCRSKKDKKNLKTIKKKHF